MLGKTTGSGCGGLLKHWRALRKVSQLELAGAAGVSARHLSFLESGRSQPSRQMVLTLAEALDVPLRERNALLDAAGFAPVYRESALNSAEVATVLKALETVLERMHPYPCVVMDSSWLVLRANNAATRLIATLMGPSLPEPPLNLMKILFSSAMREAIVNWEQIAPTFVQQLHREVLVGSRPAKGLLEFLLSQPGIPAQWRAPDLGRQLPSVVPLVLKKGPRTLSLFTTLTTLGTPLDVTLQELRIETYLPADAASEAVLRQLVAG